MTKHRAITIAAMINLICMVAWVVTLRWQPLAVSFALCAAADACRWVSRRRAATLAGTVS